MNFTIAIEGRIALVAEEAVDMIGQVPRDLSYEGADGIGDGIVDVAVIAVVMAGACQPAAVGRSVANSHQALDTHRMQRSRQATTLTLMFLFVLIAGMWGFWPGDAVPQIDHRTEQNPATTAPAKSANRIEAVVDRVESQPIATDSVGAPGLKPTQVLVRVVDHDGLPLAGIEVRVAQPGRWGTWKGLQTGATAPDGTATFTGYPRDNIWAEVNSDTLPRTYATAARAHGSLRNHAMLTLTLECPLAGTLHGRVSRARGQPVADAPIYLRGLDHDARSTLVRTDANGRFRLDHAHPGTWQASIRVDDRRRWIGSSLPTAQRCLVTPGGITAIELKCAADGQWLFGRVVDQQSRPVAGVLVSAGTPASVERQSVPKLAGQAGAYAITDSAGTYRLGPLPSLPQAIRVGDRHGSDGVTRDLALFTAWPDPFLATPGDETEHLTSVEVVADAIEWRIRPRLAPELARHTGLSMTDVRGKVGWCRLFPDDHGAWTLRTRRRGRDRLFVVSVGNREWRIEIPEPSANRADIALALPPRPRQR